MDIWKEFEGNVITHSAAHHLMAVDSLIRLHGYARVCDVARLLEITAGSVSISLKPLKSGGFIHQDENRFLRLTPKGQHLVDILRARRAVIVRFLGSVLGVSRRQAEIDSCKVEHLLSVETAHALTDFLRYVGSGDPAAVRFRAGLARFDPSCDHSADGCPCSKQECLSGLAEPATEPWRTGGKNGRKPPRKARRG